MQKHFLLCPKPFKSNVFKESSSTILIILLFLYLPTLVGCGASKHKKMIEEEEKQAVVDLLRSSDFKIEINTITPTNGLYYDVENQGFNIQISPKEIWVKLPTIDKSAYSVIDNKIYSEDTINIRTDYFTYDINPQPLNIHTLSFVVKEVEPELEFSAIVTEFGDCTIFLKQGDWDSCGYLGSLVSN